MPVEMQRMRTEVLVFVKNYLPGYKSGGPVRSIANAVGHLSNDFEFEIVTSDRDVNDAHPYPGIQADDWNVVGGAKVFYMSPSRRRIRDFMRLMKKTSHDIVYLNSLFACPWTLFPLLFCLTSGVPVILAPRGELAKDALALGGFKKRPFLKLFRLLNMHRRVIWQASSDYEKQDIEAAMGSTNLRIVVVPNMTPPAAAMESIDDVQERGESAPLRIVFLARIAPIKNLDYALECVNAAGIECTFDIYGMISDAEYWSYCQQIIECAPENVRIRYLGALSHDGVLNVLRKYDLYFLPTKGENFGHSIVEALSVGLPVLISDRTPWHNLRRLGSGAELPLSDKGAFIAALQEFSTWPRKEWQKARRRARSYATEIMSCDDSVKRNRTLFLQALEPAENEI